MIQAYRGEENPAKRRQWAAFLRKGRLEADALALEEVVAFVEPFLMIAAVAVATEKLFEKDWLPVGSWQEKDQS